MTGDQQDIFNRLKRTLPPWFGSSTTFIDALLWGLAYALAFVYDLYTYAKLQTRILTATDGWLDMIAYDFFGDRLRRRANEQDAAYRVRILIAMFRERATRAAVVRIIEQLTGRTPRIVEPWRPLDTGAWSVFGGWSQMGGYGSLISPYQAFVTVYRPAVTGPQDVAGWGVSVGGWSQGSRIEYAPSAELYTVNDADIYAAIEAVKPIGTRIWVAITNAGDITDNTPAGLLALEAAAARMYVFTNYTLPGELA